jgi:allantoinase
MTDPLKPFERLDYQASIDRPRLALPDGKRVAVFLVVNIERWDIDRAMPRQVLSAPQGAAVIPDLPNWAWHEYGMRVGFWRLKAALDRHGIAAHPGDQRHRALGLSPGHAGLP